jgi:4-hydroxy-2-oxoheptanedioate aldolase
MFGGWCSSGSSFTAELMAVQGFDFIGLDAQHGLFSYATLAHTMTALGRTHTPIVVRMPSRDPAAAARIIDAGAHGLIFPMVETADHAREAVQVCRRYDASCIVMIETATGAANADAIAAVPGVDCIYIGPGDLAVTLGLPPGLAPVPGPHSDAIACVLEAGRTSGVAVGIPCAGSVQALELARDGFTLLAVGTDTWWLTECATREAVALRQAGHLASS